MRRARVDVLVFFQAVVVTMAAGQVPPAPMRFTVLLAPNAISDRATFVVTTDQQGFFWVGTNDGLTRFDGYRAITWRHDPADSTSLANNTVRRILEDGSGNLWIRTESTLDRLDRVTGRFRHYELAPREMLLDRNGQLLVASSGAVHRYDAERDAFHVIVQLVTPDTAAAPDPVWGFFQGRDGKLWVTTEAGWLAEMTVGSPRARWRRSPWRYPVLGYQDRAGRVWIGHERGVGAWVPDENRFGVLDPARDIAGPVLQVLAARDSMVWIAGAGIARLVDGADGPRATEIAVLPEGPLARPIWWVHDDARGLTWAASGRGLLYHDPWRKPFTSLQVHSEQDASAAAVMALTTDERGRLWAGSLGGGVTVLTGDRLAGAPSLGSTSACPPDVWALQWHRQRLWIGTSRGLCIWDPAVSRVTPVRLVHDGPIEPFVFALVVDGADRIWAGTSDGLVSVDTDRLTIRRVKGLDAGTPGVVRVEGLTVARDGRLLVGTSRSDVFAVDPHTHAAVRLADGNLPLLRGSEGFWTIAEEADGGILLGGDRGLFRLNPSFRTLDVVGDAHGVSVSRVYAAINDDSGGTWLSSDAGVVRLVRHPAGFYSRTYGQQEGVRISEFNRRAFARLGSGDVAFGGMGGVVQFRPGSLRDNPAPPPIVLTAADRLTSSGPEPVATHGLVRLDLPVGARGFAIEFAGLAPAEQDRVRYHYRLTGVDPVWVSAPEDRRVRYPALQHGRYSFEVRATIDGLAQSTFTLPISVPAPFWVTWWFRVSVTGLAFTMLLAIVRAVATRRMAGRIRRLELERRLQGERERISADLHDHVGGQLTTLLSGIELAQLSNAAGQHQDAAAHLDSIATDARHTLNQLRETVWSLRTEALTARGLADQIEEDLRARQRYRARPILSASVDSADRSLTTAEAMHLFRIAQEAVSNAVAHAGASRVEVTLRSRSGGALELTVLDDGTHRPAGARAPLNGLGVSGMRARASQLGAEFHWGPADTGGTLVRVVAPPHSAPE